MSEKVDFKRKDLFWLTQLDGLGVFTSTERQWYHSGRPWQKKAANPLVPRKQRTKHLLHNFQGAEKPSCSLRGGQEAESITEKMLS